MGQPLGASACHRATCLSSTSHRTQRARRGAPDCAGRRHASRSTLPIPNASAGCGQMSATAGHQLAAPGCLCEKDREDVAPTLSGNPAVAKGRQRIIRYTDEQNALPRRAAKAATTDSKITLPQAGPETDTPRTYSESLERYPEVTLPHAGPWTDTPRTYNQVSQKHSREHCLSNVRAPAAESAYR